MGRMKLKRFFGVSALTLSFLFIGSNGQAGQKAAAETVWVLRSDGALQCGMAEPETLEAGAQELLKAGVKVLEQRKQSDGKMRIQVCGAPQGSTNAYRIAKRDLKRAKKLGFLSN
jgi:hypothetical protein